MRTRRLGATMFALALGLPGRSGADDLKHFFPDLAASAQAQLQIAVSGSGSGAGSFLGTLDNSAALAAYTNQVIEQINNYPVASTVAGFTYRYDPTLNVFERSTEGLGPILSERAQTTGKGKLNVALGYSYVSYSTLNGQSLKHLDLNRGNPPVFFTQGGTAQSSDNVIGLQGGGFLDFSQASLKLSVKPFNLVIPDCGAASCPAKGSLPVVGTPGTYLVSTSVPQIQLDSSLRTQVWALFLNYGVTDKIDVGIVLPVLDTHARGSARIKDFVDPSTGGLSTLETSGQDQATALGDMVVRGKMNFYEGEHGGLAGRLDVFLPTGDPDQLAGYGHVVIGTTLIASGDWSIFEPHATLGLLVHTSNRNLHEARYDVGVDVRITEWLTATTDVLADQHLDYSQNGDLVVAAATGLKVNPWRRLVLSGNLLWALNGQGLRAKVIPSFAIEYTFR